jgi:hypothetical protein
LLALLAAGCDRRPAPAPAPSRSALDEARDLIAAGQPDAALARLQGDKGPASLLLQAKAWSRKTPAGAPTPAPPAPGKRPEPAPEFHPEELQALQLVEQAVAADAQSAEAQLALADLLAPHALRRAELEKEAAKRRRPVPTPAPEVPDFSPGRVVAAYQAAAEIDKRGTGPVVALIEFAARAGKLEVADEACQQYVARQREKPEPYIRYGDFLAADKADPEGAITQYRQALIWRSNDDATRTKIADIYIQEGIASFQRREFATAQARFEAARPWVVAAGSPQAKVLSEYGARLAEMRGRQ